jgi:hypothetical protein
MTVERCAFGKGLFNVVYVMGPSTKLRARGGVSYRPDGDANRRLIRGIPHDLDGCRARDRFLNHPSFHESQ